MNIPPHIHHFFLYAHSLVWGTYKVRNEIETKRNEAKRNQRKRNETKRDETKSTKTKPNETKSTKWKRNKTKHIEQKFEHKKMDSCNFTDKTLLKKYFYPCVISAVLTHGHARQLHGDPRAYGPHANLCMLCTAFFLINTFLSPICIYRQGSLKKHHRSPGNTVHGAHTYITAHRNKKYSWYTYI
jgi:hypothetical protein